MKTILVTGAAGFIGFHAALRLQKEGYRVIGLDSFNSYYDPLLKKARANVLLKQGIDVIEGDICDIHLVMELFQQHDFSHVLHLAAQAGVRYSLKNPKVYLSSNIDGFVTLLEVCKEKKGLPFIYASSSSVYGCNQKIPFSENDPTDSPANLYGATKKANEVIAYSYAHLYGLKTTGLRFFTVYGPWGRPDMAYFSFTKALLESKPIELFNHGKMKRDFTYITDIIEGIVSAVEKAYAQEIFNLGNCVPEDLYTFVQLLESATGKKAIIHHQPMQAGDMEVTFADIEHSKKMLSFDPKITLEVGIFEFVNWYRSYYG